MSYNLETRIEKLERRQPTSLERLEQMTDAELEAELARIHEQFFQLSGVHMEKLSPAEHRMLSEALEKGGETETTVLEQLRTRQAAEAAAGAS